MLTLRDRQVSNLDAARWRWLGERPGCPCPQGCRTSTWHHESTRRSSSRLASCGSRACETRATRDVLGPDEVEVGEALDRGG